MSKVKIPKRVGIVKIPKKVRKKANKAIRMADGARLRDLAAAAIGAAATTRRVSRGERAEANGERQSAAATMRIDADRFGEAFRNAAIDGFRRFLEGFEEGLRDAGATIDGEARESSGGKDRKKASRRSPDANAA